jgi:predicted amidophosphoribosyltransferase
MRRSEIYGMIGMILGLAGLFLFILWINDFLPFIRFSLAVLLLGVGIWAIGVAAGVSWGNIFTAFRQAITRLASVSSPAVSPSPWRCPSCGRPVEEKWRFCLHCGNPLNWETCPRCGQTQLAIGEFCGFCGAPLKGETQPTG